METNESIVARDIASLGDRRIVGKVKALTIDCESMAVDHYLANSSSTSSFLVLPFEKTLGVGDTFLTIQDKEDFYDTDTPEAKRVVEDGYRLLKAKVFSRGGNALGVVKSYEYDTTFGTVTKINLNNETSFEAESFMFFTPEFVFVDDGVEIEVDRRQKQSASSDEDVIVVEEEIIEIEPEEEELEEIEEELEAIEEEDFEEEELEAEIAEEAEEAEELGEEEAEEVEEEEAEEEAAEEEAEDSDEEEAEEGTGDETELKAFLVGLPVNTDVASTDGEFKIEKGTVLTEELVDEAAEHDALLKLTMSVDA